MKLYILLITISLLVVPGCGDSDSDGGVDPKATTPTTSALDVVWTEDDLGDALGAATVRADSTEGGDVVVTGRVRDFVEGHAAIRLIDLKLKSCRERPGDNCPTPWDYCCDTPDDRRDSTITVEIHENGRPVRAGLKGFNGLDYLDKLVVRGKVARDDAGNVTVVADAIRKL